MVPPDPAPDSIVWADQGELMNMGGLHDNSVLFYFAKSPHFDPTSNNAILFSQSIFNPRMMHIIGTRASFEARLKTMAGLEFMVAQEPALTTPGAGTGVWVIRKQIRRKRQGQEDETTVLGTYYIVGDRVYAAPSVAEVLGVKMIQVIDGMNKFLAAAASLPEFTPSRGHTYPAPPVEKASKGVDGLSRQTSKEPSPALESSQTKKPYPTTQTNTQISNQLLAQTISTTIKYGDEYMDETLITGQPGDFHMSTATKNDRLAVPVITKAPLVAPKPTPAPPPALKTDVPPVRKGTKTEKSPKTPGPKPKRRKSKALNSAGGLSPT